MYDENLLLHLMGDATRPQVGARPNASVPCPDMDTVTPQSARPLAMVYSPRQEWRELYENEAGHGRGTIFKELEFPFLGGDFRD